METESKILVFVAVLLIIIAVLLMIMNVIVTFGELVDAKIAKPPKQKSFREMLFTQNQHQTILVPALSALVSSLLVNLSASFLYAGYTGEKDEWSRIIGLALFITGAAALIIILRLATNGVGEPAALAREPFTIRAAAEDFTANPSRGILEPEVLTQQLEEWEKYIDARSMNVFTDKSSDRLKKILTQAAQSHGLRSSISHSLQVYYAALLKFPLRFGWPFVSIILFLVGVLGVGVGQGGLSFIQSVGLTLVFIFGIASVLFYCGARGNRARLWHRINQAAFVEAEQAISKAGDAQTIVRQEEEIIKQVITRADLYLREVQSESSIRSQEILRVGKFRLSIVNN